MSDAELASIVRKLVHQARHGRAWTLYLGIEGNSVCIDGWVEDLTEAEVAALRALDTEERASAEKAYAERQTVSATLTCPVCGAPGRMVSWAKDTTDPFAPAVISGTYECTVDPTHRATPSGPAPMSVTPPS